MADEIGRASPEIATENSGNQNMEGKTRLDGGVGRARQMMRLNATSFGGRAVQMNESKEDGLDKTVSVRS